MNKKWVFHYNNNEIIITNKALYSSLSINGHLQDEKRGLSIHEELCGKLTSGEEVLVELTAGVSTVNCRLWIDKVLQSIPSE